MLNRKPASGAPSRGDLLPVDRLDTELVRGAIAMWRALCHEARFPARASMTSCLTGPLREGSFLVEVLEGGSDYRYRDVGARGIELLRFDNSFGDDLLGAFKI